MLNAIIVVVYFAILVGLGYLGMRKTRTLGDFFLGGRTLGPWITAFAYGTTYFSAVLIVGFAGKIGWGFGFDSMWIVVGNTLIGTTLAWLLLARRTRNMSYRLNAMTMPQFLGARFDSQFLKVGSALIIFVFLLPYSASVFMGLSYLFEVNLHIPYFWAVVAMGIGTAIYLVMGGYHAIALTDLFQGIIMVGGAVLMVFFVLSAAGGLAAVQTELPVRYAQHVPNPGGFIGILPLVLLTSLGPLGLPQMVQKFYAIKNEAVIRTGLIVATAFSLLMSFAAYFTGSMSHLFFDKLPQGGPDLLVPTLIAQVLPATLATVVLLLVLSASMSTLSSLILVSSSSVAMDLFAGVLRPGSRQETVTVLMRALCALFIALSMAIAIAQPAIIVSLMSMSWGTVAGSFIAPYAYGLFWKRTTRAGAIAGMLSGLLIAVSLNIILGTAQSPLAGAIAMIAPLFVVPAVSLVTQPMPSKHVETAFVTVE
ncbi:MAG: sodium:solute symporter family protein [Chloroflexota bacterium]